MLQSVLDHVGRCDRAAVVVHTVNLSLTNRCVIRLSATDSQRTVIANNAATTLVDSVILRGRLGSVLVVCFIRVLKGFMLVEAARHLGGLLLVRISNRLLGP